LYPSFKASRQRCFFLRAGKVSMRANCVSLLTCSCTVMRTRPRPSGDAARVHNVWWTLVLDGPKRSVDVGEHEVRPVRKPT